MVNIISRVDCGNSPKKLFLQEFNIAFAEGNTTFITDNITDDITWQMVGDQCIEGREAFSAAVAQMKDEQATELSILNVITHGKEGAVNGEITMGDGKKYAFCDVYEFSSAAGNRLKTITSYVIELKADS